MCWQKGTTEIFVLTLTVAQVVDIFLCESKETVYFAQSPCSHQQPWCWPCSTISSKKNRFIFFPFIRQQIWTWAANTMEPCSLYIDGQPPYWLSHLAFDKNLITWNNCWCNVIIIPYSESMLFTGRSCQFLHNIEKNCKTCAILWPWLFLGISFTSTHLFGQEHVCYQGVCYQSSHYTFPN